ncbi:transcriptional regulator, partial [Escherichia coli]|nr:transcriptional regulator [Escherichia coli]
MYLKLAIVNNSGNVGKSTICQTLLKPRLEGSE